MTGLTQVLRVFITNGANGPEITRQAFLPRIAAREFASREESKEKIRAPRFVAETKIKFMAVRLFE